VKQAYHRIWENVRHLPELRLGIKTLCLMGITSTRSESRDTYTVAGNYKVRCAAEALDGKSAEKTFSIAVSGSPISPSSRRYTEPQE
jgi:hypothetical protein